MASTLIQISDVKSFLKSLGHHNDLVYANNLDETVEIVKSLVALANSDGGIQLIGVDEKGKVIGINPFDLSLLQDFCKQNISPQLELMVDVYQLNHKSFFKIEVQPSNTLHSYKDMNQKWVRSLVVDGEPIVANEVLEELLNLKVDKTSKEKQSQNCCNEIIVTLTQNGNSSFTKISADVGFKRKEVVFNLAVLILEGRVNFCLKDTQFTYFLN